MACPLGGIFKHLHLGKQCLVVGRVKLREPVGTVLLKQSVNLSGETGARLIRKNGSDRFQRKYRFGGCRFWYWVIAAELLR